MKKPYRSRAYPGNGDDVPAFELTQEEEALARLGPRACGFRYVPSGWVCGLEVSLRSDGPALRIAYGTPPTAFAAALAAGVPEELVLVCPNHGMLLFSETDDGETKI